MTPAETRTALVEAMADGDWSREDGRLGIAGRMLEALSAKLAELGLKIVPVEATEEIATIGAVRLRDFFSHVGPYPRTKAMWSAMVAAAPDVLGGGDE